MCLSEYRKSKMISPDKHNLKKEKAYDYGLTLLKILDGDILA